MKTEKITTTVRPTSEELEALHDQLGLLSDVIDDETHVPDRYKHTLEGALAEADVAVITHAREVIARLRRSVMYPDHAPTYFAPEESDVEPVGSRRADQ